MESQVKGRQESATCYLAPADVCGGLCPLRLQLGFAQQEQEVTLPKGILPELSSMAAPPLYHLTLPAVPSAG